MCVYIYVHIHTYRCIMEYYSARRRNGIVSFTETWMDLGSLIQSEVSQKEKNKCCILTAMGGIYKNGVDDLICKTEIETEA